MYSLVKEVMTVISYAPFWDTMKNKGLTTYALIHKYHIANGTLYRMRKGRPITTETINQLCEKLDCRVEEIIVYVK